MVNISLSPKRRTIINSFGKHQNYDARSPILWCPFKLTNSFFVLIWKIKIGTFIFWVFYVSLYVLRKTWFYQDVPGINECTVPKKTPKRHNYGAPKCSWLLVYKLESIWTCLSSKHLKGQLWPRISNEKCALSHSVSWRSVATPRK